MLGLWHFFSNE